LGKYFDIGSDSLITFLAIIKAGWFLQNYQVYIVAGLYLASLLIHFSSKLKAPVLFLRTPALLVMIVGTSRQFLYTRKIVDLIGHDVAIIVSGNGLQQWAPVSDKCAGWLTGIGNVWPKLELEFYEAHQRGDQKTKDEIIDKVDPELNLANAFLAVLIQKEYGIYWQNISFVSRTGGQPSVSGLVNFIRIGIRTTISFFRARRCL